MTLCTVIESILVGHGSLDSYLGGSLVSCSESMTVLRYLEMVKSNNPFCTLFIIINGILFSRN